MIVDPDFPDHWKTRLLVELLGGDEVAPLYLIRLWAHCQNRRASTFENLPPLALKALCRYPGHANKLESGLTSSGFVRREGQHLVIVGWDEYNASLVANWENGKRGGRPPKPKPPLKPTDNPPETHGEPIGEEKKGIKDRERPTAGAGFRRPSLDESKAAAANLGVTPDKADEWWHAREASEWLKGMAGGGTTPVGTNWQADLKTYAMRAGPPASIGRSSIPNGGKVPERKPLTKLTWE